MESDAVGQHGVHPGEVGKLAVIFVDEHARARDLIRVGGGLKPSADAQAADLTK